MEELREQIESLVREAAADQVAVCPDLIDARAYAEKIIAIVRTAIEGDARQQGRQDVVDHVSANITFMGCADRVILNAVSWQRAKKEWGIEDKAGGKNVTRVLMICDKATTCGANCADKQPHPTEFACAVECDWHGKCVPVKDTPEVKMQKMHNAKSGAEWQVQLQKWGIKPEGE